MPYDKLWMLDTFINSFVSCEYLLINGLKVESACTKFIERIGVCIDAPDNSPLLRQHIVAQTGSIAKDQAKIQLMLKHSDKLLELLEIPQLMVALVKNAYYEEALELLAHVLRLRSRYRRVSLMEQIETDVRQSIQVMLQQLLMSLKDGINLHSCIRVIGYLRRLRMFSDAELRILFLEARLEHFYDCIQQLQQPRVADLIKISRRSSINQLRAAGADTEVEQDAINYLKSLLDTARNHLIDIITQYQAIFSDVSSSTTASVLPSNDSTALAVPNVPSTVILCSFIHYMTTDLIQLMERNLDFIADTTALTNLLTQSMHFGVALSRKGVDIRSSIVPLFKHRILAIYNDALNKGVQDFIRFVEEHGIIALRPGAKDSLKKDTPIS
jgi:hypothetical protein